MPGPSDVAKALDHLAEKGNLLDPTTHASEVRYGGYMPSGHRARLQRAIVDEYLGHATRDIVIHEHRAAVVTAGPPGAGKSHALEIGFDGYRPIDPDEVKDLLLAKALRDGDYEAQLAQTLPDGYPIMPREMSSLFHEEAWRITHQIRRICFQRGENVALQGTLNYPPYATRILDELVMSDYTDLTMIAINVTEDVAHRQAMGRWWSARQEAISGGDPYGGRYLNVHRLAESYWSIDGASLCVRNAHTMEQAARQAGLSARIQEITPGSQRA